MGLLSHLVTVPQSISWLQVRNTSIKHAPYADKSQASVNHIPSTVRQLSSHTFYPQQLQISHSRVYVAVFHRGALLCNPFPFWDKIILYSNSRFKLRHLYLNLCTYFDVCTYVMSVLFIFVYGGLIYAYAYTMAQASI